MSKAGARVHAGEKGKLAQRDMYEQQQYEPSGDVDFAYRQREYHQRMIEHVRNNALDSLNTNPLHPPITPSSFPLTHYQGQQESHASPLHSGTYIHTSLPYGPTHRSDTGSTAASTSLPSPGPQSGTADLAQIGFSSRPHSSSTSLASYTERTASTDKVDPVLASAVPFGPPNAQRYLPVLDTSVYHNGTDQITDRSTPFLPAECGNFAHQLSGGQPDMTLGLGLDMAANPGNAFYPQYDTTIYPYGIPSGGAFGYSSGIYSSQFQDIPSPLVDVESSINPGFLHAPALMTTSLSQGSRMSHDDHNQVAQRSSMEYAASPLHSVSPSPSPIEAESSKRGFRRSSDSVLHQESAGSVKRGHKRKMTWTSGMANEGPNVSQEQKEHELAELERLEAGGAATRRERRRLQNRLAQRAFRARSKLQNNAAATHLTDLEELADVQAEQLEHMQVAMDKLQAENLQLRAVHWDRRKPTVTTTTSTSGPVAKHTPPRTPR